jgi:Ca2+-binding EF-hand superfamily protein
MCVDKFLKDDDNHASEVEKYFNRANMDGDGHINQREFSKFLKDVGIKLSIYENLVLYKSIDRVLNFHICSV